MARTAENSGVALLLLTLLVILGTAAKAAPWLGERLALDTGSGWLIDAAVILALVGGLVYALRSPPRASVGALLLIISAGLAFEQDLLAEAVAALLAGDVAASLKGFAEAARQGLAILGPLAQIAVAAYLITAVASRFTAPKPQAAPPPSRPPAPRQPAPRPPASQPPRAAPPRPRPAAAPSTRPREASSCPRLSEWGRIIAEGRVDVLERCWVGRELYGYVVEELLGVGGFGVVLKARPAFEAHRHVAIKVMHPITEASRVGDAVTSRSLLDIADSLSRESRNLEEMSRKSPFIVDLLAIHMDLNMLKHALRRGETEVYLKYPPAIIMEYMAGGDLNRFLDEMIKRHGSERLRRSGGWRRASAAILYALSQALQVIHESGYIHSDVKPQNVLFTAKPPQDPLRLGDTVAAAVRAALDGARRDPLPKLSDLGSAVKIGDMVAEFTALYADPALLLYEALCLSPNADLSKPECQKPPLAHPSMDVYSLGLIAIQLYAAIDSKTLRGWRQAGTLDDPARTLSLLESLGVPREAAEFIARMIDPNPQARPSSREAAEFFAQQADLPPPSSRPREGQEARV